MRNTCSVLQNSSNDGLTYDMNYSENISIWKCLSEKIRLKSELHLLLDIFTKWTQRRNETPTLQTRARICRHKLTHPWDWASNFIYLVCNTTTKMYLQNDSLHRPIEQWSTKQSFFWSTSISSVLSGSGFTAMSANYCFCVWISRTTQNIHKTMPNMQWILNIGKISSSVEINLWQPHPIQNSSCPVLEL